MKTQSEEAIKKRQFGIRSIKVIIHYQSQRIQILRLKVKKRDVPKTSKWMKSLCKAYWKISVLIIELESCISFTIGLIQQHGNKSERLLDNLSQLCH